MSKTVTKVVEKNIKCPTIVQVLQLSSGYNKKEIMAKSTFSAREPIPHCPDSIFNSSFMYFVLL